MVNLPPFKSADSNALKLAKKERSILMNHLIDIKDVLSDPKATEDAKQKLIDQNDRFVFQLMKMSRKKQSKLEGDVNTDKPALKRPRSR